MKGVGEYPISHLSNTGGYGYTTPTVGIRSGADDAPLQEAILDAFSPPECANYIKNAGYASA